VTFGNLKTSVRRKLNERTAAFYSDDDIARAINEGYTELADATEFYERYAYVPMLKKRTYYDLSLILPDTFLSPRRIYNPTTSRWLEAVDPLMLDRNRTQWEIVDGQPEQYLLRGNWWLGVFPRPTADSQGLRFYHTAIPPVMTDDSETPEQIPQEFHRGLEEYALCDLMGQRRETRKALKHWDAYMGYQEALAMYVDKRTRLAHV
jgi:hypothetical protein